MGIQEAKKGPSFSKQLATLQKKVDWMMMMMMEKRLDNAVHDDEKKKEHAFVPVVSVESLEGCEDKPMFEFRYTTQYATKRYYY